MKILFVAPYSPLHLGGVEKHVAGISKELIAKGHTITVICEQSTKQVKAEGIDNLKITEKDFGQAGISKKFRIWNVMLSHFRLFLDADIIHVHDVFIWVWPIRIILFWKPFYATFHGYESFPPTKRAVLIRKISAWMCTKTIDIGEYLGSWYGTKPDMVQYGGVDFPVVEIESQSNSSNHCNYLLLARLEKENAILKYIEFFKYLTQESKKSKMQFSLTVAGSGNTKYSSQLKKYGRVLGMVSGVYAYIAKANIVCASSYLAILESLNQYKPVIAFYDNPLKKEYLEKTPFAEFCIISSDPKIIATQVCNAHLAFSQQQKKKITNLISQYTWDNIAEKYEKLWNSSNS